MSWLMCCGGGGGGGWFKSSAVMTDNGVDRTLVIEVSENDIHATTPTTTSNGLRPVAVSIEGDFFDCDDVV